MNERWEKCEDCGFMIHRNLVVQFVDAGSWNYCPSCSEPWSSESVEIDDG